MLGITHIDSSQLSLTLSTFVDYAYTDPGSGLNSIQIGYTTSINNVDDLGSAFIAFNPEATCSGSNYYAYSTAYETLPLLCQSCDSTCQTCMGSVSDPAFTNQFHCLTCPSGRYFEQLPGYEYGECKCLRGMQVAADGTCLACEYNCLEFTVTFMKSETEPSFILIFTKSGLTFERRISQNLRVSVDGQPTAYEISEHLNDATYIIKLEKEKLEPCESTCEVNFFFSYPE